MGPADESISAYLYSLPACPQRSITTASRYWMNHPLMDMALRYNKSTPATLFGRIGVDWPRNWSVVISEVRAEVREASMRIETMRNKKNR